MSRVVFLDTSVLLNILDVPGKNADRNEVTGRFKQHLRSGATLVIPVAAVVEVGNHLAHLSGVERRDRAVRFAEFLRKSLQGVAPWVVSGASWDAAFLRGLLDGEPHRRPGLVELCTRRVGTGDAAILLELQRYRERSDLPSGLPDTLWTLDEGLAAYA